MQSFIITAQGGGEENFNFPVPFKRNLFFIGTSLRNGGGSIPSIDCYGYSLDCFKIRTSDNKAYSIQILAIGY